MDLLGFLIPLAVVIIFLSVHPQVQINATQFLPDDPVLTENAIVTVEDSEKADISIASTGKDSMIRIQSDKYGTTGFTIEDGEKEYNYTIEIYEDEKGHIQIRITPGE